MFHVILFLLMFPIIGVCLIIAFFKQRNNTYLYFGLGILAIWVKIIYSIFFTKDPALAGESTVDLNDYQQGIIKNDQGGADMNMEKGDSEVIEDEDVNDGYNDDSEELSSPDDEDYENDDKEDDENDDKEDDEEDEEDEEEDDEDDEDEEYEDTDEPEDEEEYEDDDSSNGVNDSNADYIDESKNNINSRRYIMNNLFDSFFFIRALPNEYLVRVGKKSLSIVLGGTAFRLFKKFIKVPASAEITSFEIECSTSNYLGVIVTGYVAWRIDSVKVETAIRSLDFHNISNPLEKTSNLICDMVKDAVRRSIAEIKVSDILKSSEKLKSSIEGILKNVSTWGLLVDTIGINKIYIKSENVYDDLPAEDRNVLHLASEISSQQTQAKIEEDKIEHSKEFQVQQSKLKETEIREQMKQDKMKVEAEMAKVRLQKEKEKDEIRLSQELEKSRYSYQKERSIHDRELQQHRYVMDMKNLEIVERKRIVEGGLTDRELTELMADRLSDISSMYKDANLTVIGDSADSMNAIVAPIHALTSLIKGFMNTSKVPDSAGQGKSVKKQ